MAWHTYIANERTHTGGMRRGYTRSGNIVGMKTSRDRVIETFALLRHDVLISGDGENRLKTFIGDTSRRKVILSQVSSYIDQAENFYTYARDSDYRSSALLYYYAFLNLAKAAILMHDPSKSTGRFNHGASPTNLKGSLKSRALKVCVTKGEQVSVFNELYKIQFGKYLEDKKILTINSMLGYLTDNRYEVNQLIGAMSNKVHECKFYVLTNTAANNAWVVLATQQGFYPANFPNSYRRFVNNFERFIPSTLNRAFTYDIKPLDYVNWSFSHSKKQFELEEHGIIPLVEMYKLIDHTFEGKSADDIYDPETSFLIVDPINKNGKYNFNEVMAIYSVMFYLSNVVRYSPNEFDVSFAQNTKEGWLVKNFIETAPFTALTHLCGLIGSKKYRITTR